MPRTVREDANLQPAKPLKPARLSERASAEWDRLVGELEQSGFQVTEAHRSLLASAATIQADMADAWEAVKDGAYVETRNGPVLHPAAKRFDALRRDLIKVLASLGLRANPPKKPTATKQTLDDVLNG